MEIHADNAWWPRGGSIPSIVLEALQKLYDKKESVAPIQHINKTKGGFSILSANKVHIGPVTIAKIEYIANTIPISDVFKPSSRKSNELNLLLMDENNINSNQNKARGLCNTLFVPGSAFNTSSSSLSI